MHTPSSLVALLVALVVAVVASPDTEALVAAYNKAIDKSLFWGAYRPNLYMGIRPRHPTSLLSGLMWFNADRVENVNNIRHFCDQGLDFQGFGWEFYDPRLGGHQIMKDNELGLDLHTWFVKTSDGNWALRVKGVPRPGFEQSTNSIVFYSALESEGGMLASASGNPFEGFAPGESIKLFGHSFELQDFELEITDGPEGENTHKRVSNKHILEPSLDPERTHYMSMNVPPDQTWRMKDVFNILLQESIKDIAEKHHSTKVRPDPSSLLILRNLNNFEGNVHMVQKTFTGEFQFDVIYNSEKSTQKITQDNIPELIETLEEKFNNKFDKSFELQPPFNTPEYESFAKMVMSNLLGGIGYYYGDHLVDRNSELNEETYEQIKLNGAVEGPDELFTACPSRTFFPRGFYWDEGFHLIPVLDYDVDLTLEILKSWFNLIDEDGWIAREQILGPEARSKVPQDFQVQSPKIANPPTLMLVFVDLLTRAKEMKDSDFAELGDIDAPAVVEEFGEIDFSDVTDAHLKHPELLIGYAEEIYPKLQRHYEWFRKTQKGELEEFEREPYSPVEAYRWRGRTYTHCLPSGLDDYPRAPIPDIAELNVDLISWIGTMTRSMKQMAELLGKTEDAERYTKIEHDIKKNIEDIHWSSEAQTYCDVSVNDEDEDQFFCFKGYISLFPFLLKHMEPGSPHIQHIIELISDPDELYTPYGIRSLSRSDKFYKTGEDYWRSPIWYNINYLILDALRHYGSGANGALLDEDTRELLNETYKELRVNLVENVKKNYDRTGYLFEQYNDMSGSGQGAKHFYGWTALVVNMMKMPTSL